MSSASGGRVRQTASGNRLRDMLEWVKEITEGLLGRNSKSSGSDREHLPETPSEAPILQQKSGKTQSTHAFSKGSTLCNQRAHENYESFLQNES